MLRKTLVPALLLAALMCASPARAEESGQMTAEQFVATLHPLTGKVNLPGAQATLDIADGYSFLPAADAQRVLSELWNNPPDHDVLGMILPSTDAHAVLEDKNWAVVVTFVDEGYVTDEDAAKIDYSDMLKDMQKATKDDNEDRVKEGYPAIELMGWAEPPHYDTASHKLYWAQDLVFKKSDGSHESRTLNYAIRVLGRKGYLSLNAVAPIEELAQVRADMPQVVEMAEFDAGQRYTDYNPTTDKAAAYGIAALVAGGIAAKAGLFAKLGVLLLAFKKFIVLGVAAVGGVFAKLFKRKQA
ncbi:DUF2167 domain-containing protein [Dyella jiangningensis]|uniref:DUF2167 domain-containing protein n=1 Tax=Dyella jiangningensis TaxID=1379159 RepID=A0A328P6J3_9GAMM|nr:DUF2167 domain-containing protein [Dyella jiangningensis]RAO76626.1 hypothetical protein CA260_01495 [Dyella jiangningensis]